jgi:hypothetical protein
MPQAATSNPPINSALRIILFLVFIGTPVVSLGQSLTHSLRVELRPDSGEMDVEDRIELSAPVPYLDFVLNAGFDVASSDARIEPLGRVQGRTLRRYRARFETPARTLRLAYSGRPLFTGPRGHGGMPDGTLDAQGVYLDSRSAWHARTDARIDGMALTVVVPDGWESISVGRRGTVDGLQHWTTSQPHDALYLLAGPYQRYMQRHSDTDLSVYLLEPDDALARGYLAVMGDYLDHYGSLIGDYPYAKFAVVENRWQTGYGMPSFTLLGSRVIRLPFIPYTSLPHEILHNWWGNGVWVDYRAGNWSEGLTAYLADHWMQARRGQGAAHRLKALQRYSNFALGDRDAPLLEFVSRHNDATQAIGYSKSLMFFHMLRRELGDAAFVEGLRRLWRDHRFSAIGFEQAVTTLVGDDQPLRARAQAWLTAEGAPRIRLTDVAVDRTDDGYRLAFRLEREGPALYLPVPVAVTLDGDTEARVEKVWLDADSRRYTLTLPSRPLRLDIDPAYDLLRELDASEQPPALNRLFGGKTWLVTPTAASAPERKAWEALVAVWQRRYPDLQRISDDAIDALPADADRVVLGWSNRHLAAAAAAVARADQALDSEGAAVGGERADRRERAVVLVNNAPDGRTTAFIGAPGPEAITALARKLPHYGSYGRLLFDADGSKNLRRDRLPSDHSLLSRQLGDADVPLQLPPRAVLGEAGTG